MIFIINLLFFLYILVVVLTIAALLLITPILMEKLPWTNDKKVLAALPVHLMLLILAIMSVWKFQDWKIQYEIRTGHAQISIQYRDFLENQAPQLGIAYRKIIADRYMLEEYLFNTIHFQVSLSNHQTFINKNTQRWQMVLDQLKDLQTRIEAQAVRHQDLPAATVVLTQDINIGFQQIRHNKYLIEQSMNQHAFASIRFLIDPAITAPHYPISKKNYQRIISFFLSKYDTLIDPLNLMTQTIYTSNLTIEQLRHKLKQKRLRNRSVIKDVFKAWKHTKHYTYTRLFKVLYALETEYVLQRMGMQESHPTMRKLQEAISHSISLYSKDINALWLATKQSNNPKTVLALH
jgi:hypothetical protein